MLQNEWQPNILDRLYQIMFKIIILSQIGADRYQKHIFEILLLSAPWRAVQGRQDRQNIVEKNVAAAAMARRRYCCHYGGLVCQKSAVASLSQKQCLADL